MTRNRPVVLGAIILGVAISFGCRKKASDEIDFGTVEGSEYRNRYFGMTVSIPSDWSVQDRESKQRLADAGGKMIAGDDKNLQAVIKASEQQIVNLLAAFKHSLGTPVPFNPSILCLAERVSHLPGIARGKDYLFHTKTLLESGQMDISFPREVFSEKVGGVEFDVLSSETAMAGTTVQQEYYAAIMKGYALVVIISFVAEEDESSLRAILASVTFERN